jgi:FSR family fosmidomycin resistance protein-like MFS transporter
MNTTAAVAEAPRGRSPLGDDDVTAFAVLGAVSLSHLLNDVVQSLLPAIYPVLKASFGLTFAQIGFMTLALMLTASLLQPVVGYVTDKRPAPHALTVGMALSLVGLLMLGLATSYWMLLAAASLVGVGSSIFHPESSRIARMASGGRHGLAQSVFQVGGNAGSSLGPLLAAFVVAPYGQRSVLWCSLVAVAGVAVVWRVGTWYQTRRSRRQPAGPNRSGAARPALSHRRIAGSLAVLAALIFSKYFYLASLSSYYTFYLMTRFELSVRSSQVHLFVFLAAVAAASSAGRSGIGSGARS